MKRIHILAAGSAFLCAMVIAPVLVSAETDGPALTFTANPSTIQPGESTTIFWSTDASYCNAPGLFDGSVWNTKSVQIVSGLTSSQTYTMTCTTVGGGGSVTKSVTVTVASSDDSSDLFSFTFPKRGSTLVGGTTYSITWVNDNRGNDGYAVYLGTGVDSNGDNLKTILRTLGTVTVKGSGLNEFSWTVPTDLSSRSDYRIEFRGKGGGGGVSSPFSIESAPSSVIVPSTSQPKSNTTSLPADIDTEDSGGACLDLPSNLRYRMRDIETNNAVSSLQDYLQASGYLQSEPTGFFGLLTLQATKDFQAANSISPTGFVGPLTRAKIKALSCQ